METDDFHIEYLFKNMFSLQFSWSWDKRVFIFLRHPVHEPVNLLNQKKRKQVLLLKFCRKQGKLSYFAKCHVYVPCSYCNLLVGSNLKSWTYLNMLLAPVCIYNTHNTTAWITSKSNDIYWKISKKTTENTKQYCTSLF